MERGRSLLGFFASSEMHVITSKPRKAKKIIDVL